MYGADWKCCRMLLVRNVFVCYFKDIGINPVESRSITLQRGEMAITKKDTQPTWMAQVWEKFVLSITGWVGVVRISQRFPLWVPAIVWWGVIIYNDEAACPSYGREKQSQRKANWLRGIFLDNPQKKSASLTMTTKYTNDLCSPPLGQAWNGSQHLSVWTSSEEIQEQWAKYSIRYLHSHTLRKSQHIWDHHGPP